MTVAPVSTPGEPETPSPPARPPRRRRWLRRLALIFGIGFGVVFLVSLGLRLYFHDDRLRQMLVDHLHERSGAEVRLDVLELSLTSGLELRGFAIGALPGFSEETVRFERFAFHWSFWDLLLLEVIIDELALERPHLTIEENATGQNLAVLAARLSPPGPPEPEEPKEPEPEDKQPLAQPSFPVRVVVGRLALVDAAVDVKKPGETVHLDGANLELSFEGEGDAMAADLWLGLGDRQKQGPPAKVIQKRAEPPADIEAEQRFGLHVTSSGLGDVTVTLDADGKARVQAPYALPELASRAAIALGLDLLSQKAKLEKLDIQLGSGTTIKGALAASDILAPSPKLDVANLNMLFDFGELRPIVAATMGWDVGGKLGIDIAPFKGDVQGLTDYAFPPMRIDLTFENYRNSFYYDVYGMTGKMPILIDGDHMDAHLIGTFDRVVMYGQDLRGVWMDMTWASPVTPILGKGAWGDNDIVMNLTMKQGGSPAATWYGQKLKMNWKLPMKILLGKKPPDAPMIIDMQTTMTQVVVPGTVIKDLAVDMDAEMWDWLGVRNKTRMVATMKAIETGEGEKKMVLPATRFETDMRRDDDDWAFKKLDLFMGEVMEMHLTGSVTDSATPRPRFDRFKLAMQVPRLDAALSLLPPSQKPPMEVTGGMTMNVDVHGLLPHKELAAAAAVPKVDAPPGDLEAWAHKIQAYDDFLSSWAQRFERGMPFTLSFGLGLQDMAFADAKNEVEGLNLDASFAIEEHRLRYALKTHLARLVRPNEAKNIDVVMETTFDPEALAFDFDAKAGTYFAGLSKPLQDAAMAFKTSFKLGGDLVLEDFSVREKSYGLLFAVGGVVGKPMQMAATRGWERAGMPGVDVAMRWQTGFGTGGPPEALQPDGPQYGGKLGLDGKLAVKDGLVVLEGELGTENFAYVAPGTTLEGLSGSFPFDIRLFFGKRPDAVIVARNQSVGGGTISLLTSEIDVRSRPARPVYYDRLRAYRSQRGLTISKVISGDYEMSDFRLDGRIEGGVFSVDTLAMNILGGDVSGNMAMQLGRDASVRGDMAFKFSGVDASYFKDLKLEAGPESEINADMGIKFTFAPRERDFGMTMNVTKIGDQALDRLFQMLKKDEYRKYLGVINVREMAMWIRYENLNLDLDYTPRVVIPGTPLEWPIPREMLRRYSLKESFNTYLNPSIDQYVAKPLGWAHVQ